MQNSVEQVIDEILVMDAQNGHGEAFETLVLRWQKRLWWHAFNLTGRAEAAWDVTQESWLDIVRGLARLKEPDRFGSWAYRIVSNEAYDWCCRNGQKGSPEIEPEDTPASTADQGKQETAGDVHEILRRLSRRSQVILNLHYLEGFSLLEIAEILGIPEGTVKSRLHTARMEFRKHWESPGEMQPTPISTSGKERQHE